MVCSADHPRLAVDEAEDGSANTAAAPCGGRGRQLGIPRIAASFSLRHPHTARPIDATLHKQNSPALFLQAHSPAARLTQARMRHFCLTFTLVAAALLAVGLGRVAAAAATPAAGTAAVAPAPPSTGASLDYEALFEDMAQSADGLLGLDLIKHVAENYTVGIFRSHPAFASGRDVLGASPEARKRVDDAVVRFVWNGGRNAPFPNGGRGWVCGWGKLRGLPPPARSNTWLRLVSGRCAAPPFPSLPTSVPQAFKITRLTGGRSTM